MRSNRPSAIVYSRVRCRISRSRGCASFTTVTLFFRSFTVSLSRPPTEQGSSSNAPSSLHCRFHDDLVRHCGVRRCDNLPPGSSTSRDQHDRAAGNARLWGASCRRRVLSRGSESSKAFPEDACLASQVRGRWSRLRGRWSRLRDLSCRVGGSSCGNAASRHCDPRCVDHRADKGNHRPMEARSSTHGSKTSRAAMVIIDPWNKNLGPKNRDHRLDSPDHRQGSMNLAGSNDLPARGSF